MKKLLFIIVSLLFIQPAMAQQASYINTTKTESEVRADTAIEKLNEKVTLSPEQKHELKDILVEYLDDVKHLSVSQNYYNELNSLGTYRDNQVKKVLSDELHFTEYQKCLAVVTTQQHRGNGRR